MRTLNLYRLMAPLISHPNHPFVMKPPPLQVSWTSSPSHPDPNSYNMTFASTQESSTLAIQKGPSSGPTRVDSEPLLDSEIQEIGEEEFLNNVQQCHDLASTASKLRLPKSIKKDCDSMLHHIEELCRGKHYCSSWFFIHLSESPFIMFRIPDEKGTPNGRVS